jgi:ATP-dependent DNA helicase RecG
MPMFTVFISSVQKEFEVQRQALYHHFKADALLSQFFKPVIFEQLPAASQAPNKVYIQEVEQSQIYLGLLGAHYGYENADGISPTEQEYDLATQCHLERWIYIQDIHPSARHPKETAFINKVQQELTRQKFQTTEQLLQEVNKSCVAYLQKQGLIQHTPFDEAVTEGAAISDMDAEKIKEFIRTAKAKRNFPLAEDASVEKVLTHLGMLKNGQPVNSALLLFSKKPQQFFPAAIIKCAHFHGNEVSKPIPDYKQYGGNVFEQADQAVDFVLSKINVSVGTREESTQAPVLYELPRAAVREAIVNAVAHRNYRSTASVQVMLFADRLEVSNPGKLPPELTPQKLKTQHASYPANPRLAQCLYLTGYIEQMGTGILDIMRLTRQAQLHEPDFDIEEDFKIIIWRPAGEVPGKYRASTDQVTDQVELGSTGEVPGKYRGSLTEAERVVLVLNGEMKRTEIQSLLQLKHEDYFRDTYLTPALKTGLVEMTLPDKPKSSKQRYRLTAKGEALKKKLKINN